MPAMCDVTGRVESEQRWVPACFVYNNFADDCQSGQNILVKNKLRKHNFFYKVVIVLIAVTILFAVNNDTLYNLCHSSTL